MRQSAGSAILTSVTHGHGALNQGYVLVTKSCARSWETAIQILSETHPSSSHWNALPLQAKSIRNTGKKCVSGRKQEALPRKCPSSEFSGDVDWRKQNNRKISQVCKTDFC